jgi:hypothetical protein
MIRSMGWHGGRVLVGVGLTALAIAGVPATASARSYSAYTCRLPDGTPAAIADSTSGWRASLRPGTSSTNLVDHCTSGGGIDAAMTGSSQAYGAGATWRFTPPANTSLGGFRIEWRGDDEVGGESTLARSDDADPNYTQRNGAGPFNQTIERSGLAIQWLDAIVACSFQQPQCGSNPASFSITRARMTINDTSAPQASNVGGELPSAAVLRGPMSVSFNAQDSGGGLYRVVLAAEGTDGAAAALPDTSGRCHDVAPGNADPYEFGWPQPCPLAVQTTATVDTSGLPNGVHAITGYLEDAAGNRTTLFGPTAKVVDNSRGSLNGTNGGDGAVLTRRGRSRRTTSFGGRRIVLRGALARGGQPVIGAVLDVLAQNDVPGGRLHKIGEAHTIVRGHYSIRVAGGPSRLLRVAYRAYSLDSVPAATVDVRQRVHAGVGLHVRRRHVPAGGTGRFTGQVHGGFIPRHGKVVELQAFDGGAWRTFDSVRTNRSGRYTAHYRFRRTPPGRTFRFRARVRSERGYPFLLGVSRTVRLRVG